MSALARRGCQRLRHWGSPPLRGWGESAGGGISPARRADTPACEASVHPRQRSWRHRPPLRGWHPQGRRPWHPHERSEWHPGGI